MADDSLFLIDIDKILREKAPKHVKYIPKFVVSYLKRIVHLYKGASPALVAAKLRKVAF